MDWNLDFLKHKIMLKGDNGLHCLMEEKEKPKMKSPYAKSWAVFLFMLNNVF